MANPYKNLNSDIQAISSEDSTKSVEADSLNVDDEEDDNFYASELIYNPPRKRVKKGRSSFLNGIKDISKSLGKVNQNVADEMAKLGQGVAKSAKEMAQEVVKRSQEVAKSATDLSQEVTKSALQQGKTVQQEAREFWGSKVEKNQESLNKKLGENQVAKEASVKAFIDKINIEEIEITVEKLWEKFPYTTPEKIAQRLLLQQIVQVSKNSAVITVVPGKIAETVGIDYVAIAIMEKEIIFKIASAYGFDLWHPNRKKEAFAIIDRVLRSTRSGRIVVSLSQMIPLAGQFMNVGTDAFLVYVIGDTARKFYEAMSNEVTPGETLESFIEKTDRQCKQRLW